MSEENWNEKTRRLAGESARQTLLGLNAKMKQVAETFDKVQGKKELKEKLGEQDYIFSFQQLKDGEKLICFACGKEITNKSYNIFMGEVYCDATHVICSFKKYDESMFQELVKALVKQTINVEELEQKIKCMYSIQKDCISNIRLSLRDLEDL